MKCCGKCAKSLGVLVLVVGVLFLLRDLQVWDFWNIQWYTVLFLVWGLATWGSTKCGDCQSCCMPEPKKSSGKKKK